MNGRHFLVFWVGDGGDRESYSVFSTTIVKANSENEALDKFIENSKHLSIEDKKFYGTSEITNENYIG